ncbi:hypothetical protein BWI97_21495 [Siphonobacter sp. BAB-5405]|nr:hypothetical protein BWI97_21495 [Siphonobacter sp. BAB-5405]
MAYKVMLIQMKRPTDPVTLRTGNRKDEATIRIYFQFNLAEATSFHFIELLLRNTEKADVMASNV